MPFDAFMTAALTKELSDLLTGLKVDRINQPERDEIDLLFHRKGADRLIINCTASTPYVALSSTSRENPATPPMICMLLRKHLSRAKITSIRQIGFDRTLEIEFDSGDELGFRKTKYLYCEMMGRGSNLIFVDESGVILAAFRQNDITTKFDRVVMVGVPYRPMPMPDKQDPVTCTEEVFIELFSNANPETRADLFIQHQFSGFGKLTAREVVYLADADPEAPLQSISPDLLWKAFSKVVDRVKQNDYSPVLVYSSHEALDAGDAPIDFSFMPITHLQKPFVVMPCPSPSLAIEGFYSMRNQLERHKQHYNDISLILKNCRNRLEKKIAAQKIQYQEALDAEDQKLKGDLIMQELYRIKKADREVVAINYAKTPPEEVRILLDPKLSGPQNAQKYYREYSKKKTALVKILEQIQIAESELAYVQSVFSTLETATTASDLQEIRLELSHWSYGRRLTSSLKKPQLRPKKAKPRECKTENDFTVYVGMNNFQNDTVSVSLASPNDLWFHVKNYHGSHVLLKAEHDRAFSDSDVEFAASLAAFYSECRDADRVEVDYTFAKFIKKPNGAKPGFVTYKNHKTCLVKPESMK